MKARYTDDEVARVCHEAIRALDDDREESWDSASESMRDGTVEAVRMFRNGHSSAEVYEHWRDWRSDYDINLQPYHALSARQRDKTEVMRAIVIALTI